VEEDDFCGDYIANVLRGKGNDFDEMTRIIRETSGARFFIEENQHFAPREDFDLCLNLNKFNFVLKRYNNSGKLVLNKIDL
jgi:2-phosphosulfolactate phosphatase